MATVAELTNALSQADKAGDTRAANFFASEIRKQQASPGALSSGALPEDYSIAGESIKAIGAGVIQPVLTTVAGLSAVSADQVETGVYPFLTGGYMSAGYTRPQIGETMRQAAGTGEALDKSQEYLDFARTFPTEVMNIDPRFINNHPYIYGSMQAIGQFVPNLATAGTTLLPQLYSEYIMEAEGRLGKPRNEWTSEESGEVGLNFMPYGATAAVLEFVGLKGVGSAAVKSFLKGGTIKAGVLQRGLNSVNAGIQEGATEYAQTVLQDISQIIAGLDPEEEITLDTFFGQEARVALVSGFVGGTTARGVLETVEAVTLPTVEDADAELLFDSKFTVRYVDENGNPVQFDVDGPDKATVLRRVKEGGGIAEGSPITVTPYKGTTGSSVTRPTSEVVVEAEVLEDSSAALETKETATITDERLKDRSYQVPLEDMILPEIVFDDIARSDVGWRTDEELRELIDKEYNAKVVKENGEVLIWNLDSRDQFDIENRNQNLEEGVMSPEGAEQIYTEAKQKSDISRRTVARAKAELEARARGEVKQLNDQEYSDMLDNIEKGKLKTRIGNTETKAPKQKPFVPNDTTETDSGEQLFLPEPSQEEAAEAMATYVNKKYLGPTPRNVPKSPGYAAFLQSLGVQKYSEGRFLEISGPNKGRDLTDLTFAGGSVSVIDGKPILITEDREISDLDLKSREAAKEYGGRLVRTNLFRKGAGWKWVDNPSNIETGTIVSVDQGKHYYTMDYQINNPVKLENDPTREYVQGRPLSRGELTLGKEIGKISVRGKEHPLYDRITVGDPKPVSEIEESAQTFSQRKSGPVSIERVRQQAKLTQAFAKDTAAFYDFYLRELKTTGNLLKANNRNIRRVAEQMVKDTGDFLANNPHLASFYEEDTILTNSYLNDAFNMVQGDEKLYALIDGLMSANTKLKGNAIDSLRAFQSYKQNGNFDDMVIYQGPKGMKYDDKKSKYVLHGASSPNKARAVKAVGKLLQEMSVEETINYLTTPVTWNELKRFNKYLGYKSDPKKGELQVTIQTATGQDTMFPRVFVFGPKVGSYVMNNLGYLNYTTIDIWESRFIRSYFKGMLDETKDLPETVEERDFFQRVGEQFKIVYEERTGQSITKATAQALRWFYVLDTFAKLGYKGASTNESKSEYTREGIREVLGINLPSGRRSSEESGRAAGIEAAQPAGYISPTLRSRFSIRRNYDQISYRGRESTDPRRGYTDAGRGNVDLEVSEFVSAAKTNKDTHPFGSSVDVLSENDYVDHTLILYRSKQGGTVTASISEDGELGTITATKDKTTARDVTNTIMAAIGTGRVRWANGFDTILPDKYVPLGFKPVIKLKFDPEQAPKDWDYNKYSKYNGGKPDVVFFAFDGELNRQYSNFKDIPVTDDYITAVDAVQNTEVTGQHFKNPGELMDTVLAEFTDVAKTIGVEIEYDLSGPPAIYVAWSPSRRRGKFITFNPYTLIQRSREGVRAAIREELMHGVHHEIALKLYPNERDIGVPWAKLMLSLGQRMTPEQRDTLRSVYTTLPDLSEATNDIELQDIYKKYGSEYLRVSYQHQLFDETPEMFVEGGASWDQVTKLFKQSQKFLGDKLTLKDVRGDMNLAQLVIDSVDVIKSLDIAAPVTNPGMVEGAYAAVPERKQSKPLNIGQKLFNGIMVPFHRNLEDIHPIFKQLEIDLNYNTLRITNNRLERAKRFIDKAIKITDPGDLARLSHFISFNPRSKEELESPFGQYNIRARNEVLKKYGMYDDYKEVIRPLLNEINRETGAVGVEMGYRYEYYPRAIKDFKALRQAIDPRNLGTFETLVDEENIRRRKVGQEQMTEDERADLLTRFLRGGLRTQPIGVKIPQNAQQRLIDLIPQELTQYYEHPAHALVKYIKEMTDTVETMKVYGQYKLDPNGNGVLTGEFGRQALRLYERGEISSYELNERLPEMIKVKLGHKGKTQGIEWLPLKQARALTYMMTIGKFSTTFANILDLEIALKSTGPTTTLRAIINNNNVDLKKMGILAGKDQNEFNFDASKFSTLLNKNLQLTGFYATDAFGKRAAAQAFLSQARSRAKKLPISKEYRALEKDIDLFFPLKSQADKQNLIKDLRLDAQESIAVFNYIFAKMSNIQPLSEANYPPFYLQYPQLRFMWMLQTYAINRLNYNRKEFIDDITSGDPVRMTRGAYNMVEMAVCLMLVGVPWEALMSFLKGQPFYLSNAVLNSLARLGYGNIYTQKKLVLEGPFAFLASLVTPAGTVIGEATTDAYKVVTGQKSWKDADAIKRTVPFKELWDLLSGERDEAYKKTWKREAKKDNFPLLNSDYLGGR